MLSSFLISIVFLLPSQTCLFRAFLITKSTTSCFRTYHGNSTRLKNTYRPTLVPHSKWNVQDIISGCVAVTNPRPPHPPTHPPTHVQIVKGRNNTKCATVFVGSCVQDASEKTSEIDLSRYIQTWIFTNVKIVGDSLWKKGACDRYEALRLNIPIFHHCGNIHR